MRYVRIFLLHFQEAFEYRSRSFVWFLLALINPLLLLIFWRGAFAEQGEIVPHWSLSSVASYYFLLIIASSLLMAHIEESIAYFDIQEGGLVKYLTRPLSYLFFKFFQETPYRVIQGFFGILTFFVFALLFGKFVVLSNNLFVIGLSIAIIVLGYLIAFLFKVILGLSALWVTDYSGLQQLIEVLIIIFAGLVLPLEFFPSPLRQVSYMLPFSYMIYFPVIAIQGKLMIFELLRVIGVQVVWIICFSFLYRFVWKKGIYKFTGIGQ